MTEIHDIVTINIFTNCCNSSPDSILIKKLLESMQSVFKIDLKNFAINVMVDHHPHSDRYDAYITDIENNLKTFGIHKFMIHKTEGLSFSHQKSIEVTKTPLLLQLEQDHIFNSNINHSLLDLCNVLTQNEDVQCIQFGRLKKNSKTQHFGLEETEENGIKFCKTKYISNIPHLIKMDNVKERMKYVKFVVGSWRGIEYEVSNAKLFTNHLYGPINHLATTSHTDGCHFKQ